MGWFLIALLPPAMWSVTNHIDKYLLSRYFKGGGVGALMVFSSIIGLLLLPIIYFIHPEVIDTFKWSYLLISVNGLFYVLAVLPYFYALERDETSLTVPLFQMIPVYSFVLSYIFLGEVILMNQIIGGLLIIGGSILISIKFSKLKKMEFKRDVFLLMMLSSLLFSVNFLFFKYFASDTDFYTTSFWEYIGFTVFAVIVMLFVKSYRYEFLKVLRENSVRVLSINGLNEVINIIGKISFNWASMLIPVTLVWIVNGFQPLFVFVYGVILTIFFPKIVQEDISRKSLIQKFVAILIMFIGGILINI